MMPENEDEGTIQVDEAGNVVIGAPTAKAIVVLPDDGEED